MTSISQHDARLMRYGQPLYEVNPSLRSSLAIQSPQYQAATKAEDPFESHESDSDRFVKFYIDGIRQFARLNQPGANLFEFVCEQLSNENTRDKDTVCLNYVLANKWRSDLNRRTYSRGLADLLDKKFLFRSMLNDIYFINVRFVSNGDLLVLVKSDRSSGTNS